MSTHLIKHPLAMVAADHIHRQTKNGFKHIRDNQVEQEV